MNLKHVLEEKVLKTEALQLNACIQLVQGVRNLHSKNIDKCPFFHGNLKQTNILFDENMSLYLSDIN